MHIPTTDYKLPTTSSLRVAIVHDWLVGGGAELVVEELHRMYPEAPIYTSYSTDEWRERLDGKVITGYLQHLGMFRKYLPFLRAKWFESLMFDDYDLVISSSGAEAKGIKTGKNTLHVNYCHAPTHYYWSRYDEYIRHPGFGLFDPIARLGLKLLVGPMRKWDYKAAQRPDKIIANSAHTQKQIKKYYGRDSVVIFPPVDIKRFASTDPKDRKGFVITGRQTPYKRFDLAVAACTKLRLPLTVIGDGPEHKKLQQMAGPTIKFLGYVSNADVPKLVGAAEAFIFPGCDDFGISAVEALASGTPVIAFRSGGALDYVIEGKTGQFFDKQAVESLAKILASFNHKTYSHENIKQFTNQFSGTEFQSKLKSLLYQA